MRKVLALILTIAMLFTLSIGVMWAIADYDDDEIIHVTIGNITVLVEDGEEVTNPGDSGEVARESDDENEELVNDSELIETEWEWSLPLLEIDVEPPRYDRYISRPQRPTLTREFATEMRDRLNEEIAQAEIMPRKMTRMAQLEINNLEIYNLEITERSEFDETIFDETIDVENQIRASFYTIWMCPFDSSNIAFDEYGYQIAPYLLRNQVVFNQATGEYMWNNFVIDIEDMRYFRELSTLFERRKLVQTSNNAAAYAGLARFSAFESTIVGERPIIDIFPDPRLAQEVANFLNKTINCPVTQGRLRDVSWLSIRGGTPQIQSLEGIQYLNLSSLDLVDQNISDLEPLMGPLSELNLWWLTLDHNQISDLSPLSQLNLSGLAGIDLNHNQISDLSPLAQIHFPNLFDLHLNHNQISDLTPLINMTTLMTLSLNNNLISDPSPLSSLFGPEWSWTGLMWVNLRYNQISNLRLSMLHSGVWIDASNQIFTQPQPFTNPLSVVTKRVTDQNSWRTVEMFPITPGGVLDAQGTEITWSWSDVYRAPEYVSYGWSQGIVFEGWGQPPRNIGHFSGTVTVPISDRPMPLGIIGDLFPDQRLAQSVVTMLNGVRAGGRNGWTLGCSVAQSQLNAIPELSIVGGHPRISDLRGIQHLQGLISFTATGQNINNITPLRSLTNLASLNLSNNRIRNIVHFNDLQLSSGLEILNLSNNEIVNLTGVHNLTYLTSLTLNNNQISDLTPMRSMRGPDLQVLNLSHNEIVSLWGIENLTNLTSLTLNNNRINSLEEPTLYTPSSLRNMSGLQTLNLNNNDITNLSGLGNMTNLRTLLLRDNQINNITTLNRAVSLNRLDLSNNRISNLTQLSTLVGLSTLNLSDNQISDIRPLRSLNRLWRLDIWDNYIECIEPLSGMAELRGLYLGYNKISDVSPLRGMFYLQDSSLINNRIGDVSPLSHLTHSGNLWYINVSNQEVILDSVEWEYSIMVRNIIRKECGMLVAPSFISDNGEADSRFDHIVWSGNDLTRNVVAYSWDDHILNVGYDWRPIGTFSGTVTVEIANMVSFPTTTLRPAVDLFVRHDRGLAPQNAESYRDPNANGLRWHSLSNGSQLVIGMDHASNNPAGAHRETFMRFDVTAEQVQAIRNVSGDDRIMFNLFIIETIGTAVQRHIDLHLLPADRAGFVTPTYPSRATPRQPGVLMTAYDAFRAGITARENFRYNVVQPDAQSDRIYNPSQISPMTVDEFVSFDLTDALQRYFNENPNARSFAFVLSNLRGNGLMIVAANSHRNYEYRRPHILIPESAAPPASISTVAPVVDLFVRNDTGISARSRDEISRGGNGVVPQPENHELVIGQNHLVTNQVGAYRETFMRFNLSAAEIAGILNASGIGNNRAVLNLFVTAPPSPIAFGTAQERAINVRVVSDSAIRRGMTYLNAFDAGITSREHFRTSPNVVSEHIFLNGSGEAYTRLNRFFEIDLTAVLQRHFQDHPAGTRGSFGIVLYNLDGNALIVAASTRQDEEFEYRMPTLTVPVGEREGSAGISDVELNTTAGSRYTILVSGSNVVNGNREVTINYNPEFLRVDDSWARTYGRRLNYGLGARTDVDVIEFDSVNGLIRFRFNDDIANGRSLSGVPIIVRFVGIKEGATTVELR